MHKYNSLAFFDHATAAPYIKADMNKPVNGEYRAKLGFKRQFTSEEESLIYKDCLFYSPHKFIGGPNTPGVLIIKQHVVRNLLIPSEPGGGVVLFVRKERQNYVKNIEAREESGTPDIIGSVRIGLSLLIKEKIPHEYLLQKQEETNNYVMERLKKIPNLFVMGHNNNSENNPNRIPIYSFVIKYKGRLLHYNFVAALLNDLFGIQSRGGCSCASTYGQQCLGLVEEYTEMLEKLVCSGSEIFRPGYTRLNFPYFYDKYITDYILSAIEFVAKYGWMFLSHYAFKIESGVYYHRNTEEEKRKWLNQIDFQDGNIIIPDLIRGKKEDITKESLDKMMQDAFNKVKDIKNITKHILGKSKLNLKILFTDNDKYRWFLLPDEIEHLFYNDMYLNDEVIDDYIKEKLVINFKLVESEFICESKCLINNTKEKITDSNFTEQIITVTDDGIMSDLQEINFKSDMKTSKRVKQDYVLFPKIPDKITRLVGEACKDFDMLRDGDRILVGMSGGKDSMSLLHTLLYFQKKVPFKIEIAGVTVDPQSSDYNPRPLIEYMKKLGVKYFFESDPILERAKKSLQNDSICAYCARMKRGIIYNCARREGYNVIALGQHLDDLCESFLMSSFHNGLLRTMKANYVIDQGDLRVIRPLIYCREKLFKEFTLKNNIPVIQENCPACFSVPKERHRVKVLLAQQENLYPNLFSSLQKAMKPLMKGLLESDNFKKDDIEI